MSAPQHARVIIIGSGPAGYTAAIYAARAMLEPMLIAGFDQGGQLMITTEVENYPGFAEPIQGPWLMEQMRLQAEHVGTRLVSDHIVEARLDKRPFTLIGDSGTTYSCDALIVATGAKAKWLGIPSEEKFKGFGVSACATCDGFFFRGKKVVVVGGGNTAVEEALYLSNLASHVTLVHRRDMLRSERVLQERLRRQQNVTVLFDHVIDEILGVEGPLSVTGARVKNVKTGETQTLDAEGVFIAIGHAPASELFKGQLTVKPSGYIAVEAGTTRTNIPGVYAAGDVADEIYRQAVTAAGLGCMAALEVEKFLLDAPALATEPV
ncbi:thioredoxin-disulfide reductase [Methylocystis sp. IM3]|uniref:thioredoxin-disulfide reductase n=1 Tax=unclassified Methylocystis TaxID=2625913 RepID=UPI0030F5A1E4